MGYMAVQFAAADAAGVTSLPRRVETGFAIIDKDNVKDPRSLASSIRRRANNTACVLFSRPVC